MLWKPGRGPERRGRRGRRRPGRARRRHRDRGPRRPPARPGAGAPGRGRRASPSCPTATTTAPTWRSCPPRAASCSPTGPGSFRRHTRGGGPPRPPAPGGARAPAGLGRRPTRRPARPGLGRLPLLTGARCFPAMTSPTPLPGAPGPIPSPLPVGDLPPGHARSTDLPVPGSALAIVAHPDDAEFHCGATLAKWAAHGCVLNHLVLTDGSKGTWDADADTDALVEARRQEQMEAASQLGSRGKVVMLGHTDGELQPTCTSATRSRTGSVRSSPTSSSPTIRGSGTASIPTTATPAGWPSTGSWRPATPTSSDTTTSVSTGPRRCCCSRPTSPTTSRTCTASWRPRSTR